MVVPALAAVLNLLAVAAAYGVLVAVFQKGWGVELIGLDHAIPIVSFVPLMMFAILFGLSTDYTVFLLTRVSEEYELESDHRQAIIDGLGRAIRVIVAAALDHGPRLLQLHHQRRPDGEAVRRRAGGRRWRSTRSSSA